MAGTSYFNSGSGLGGVSPYPKIKTNPNPYTTNMFGGTVSFVDQIGFLYYAYRAGAGNRGLDILGQTSVSLIEVQSNGTKTTIVNFDPTSYLANATEIRPQQICYSTVDQCWYILLTYVNPPHCRLIKVNDTTGTVTTIGAAFNPANPTTNWPSATNGSNLTSFYLDNVTGHLKILCNGFVHLLNKSTGAIVSQDVPATLTGGTYSLLGCGYLTQNGAVAVGDITSNSEQVSIGRAVGSSGGLGTVTLPVSHLNFPAKSVIRLNYIDHDKIYVGIKSNTNGVLSVTTVAEYDKFIEAFYDYNVS